MEEWVVAVILIGFSVMVAAGLVGACRVLGGWTYLYAFVTGNKEERANLANHEELNGYAVYPPNFVERRGVNGRPLLSEQPQSFSKSLKFEAEHSFRPACNSSHPVTTGIPDPIPPPPNDPHPRKFSIDNIRRTSIDVSELPDVLTMESGSPKLQRAMSCDSVSSDTSVFLDALDSPQKLGEIEVELEYTKDELDVTVVQARGLTSLDVSSSMLDSFIKVGLVHDPSTNKQTKVCRGTDEPQYNEKFSFSLARGLNQMVLQCSVYLCDRKNSNVIGDCEVRLEEVNFKQGSYRAWLPIIDHQKRNRGYGELLFSLSYLPTAERLTVVLVKARNLTWVDEKPTADPFVKVYLLQKGKKISKKKTSIKKGDCNPTFNEAMIFSVPASALQNIQLRLTLAEYQTDGKTPAVGHVFVGPHCSGKQLSHWNQMISSPRKPIAMWHPLRKREK